MTTTISGAGSCVYSPGPGAPGFRPTRDANRRPHLCQRRFSVEPLRQVWFGYGRNGLLPNNVELARYCGVHLRQMQRWAHEGLTERYADRIACRLGVHPSWIWGDEWWRDDDRYALTDAGLEVLGVEQ